MILSISLISSLFSELPSMRDVYMFYLYGKKPPMLSNINILYKPKSNYKFIEREEKNNEKVLYLYFNDDKSVYETGRNSTGEYIYKIIPTDTGYDTILKYKDSTTEKVSHYYFKESESVLEIYDEKEMTLKNIAPLYLPYWKIEKDSDCYRFFNLWNQEDGYHLEMELYFSEDDYLIRKDEFHPDHFRPFKTYTVFYDCYGKIIREISYEADNGKIKEQHYVYEYKAKENKYYITKYDWVENWTETSKIISVVPFTYQEGRDGLAQYEKFSDCEYFMIPCDSEGNEIKNVSPAPVNITIIPFFIFFMAVIVVILIISKRNKNAKK